jgi:hypothetical protein
MKSLLRAGIAAVCLAAALPCAAQVRSVSRIEFGPDNLLFVADWKDASVHAIEVSVPPAKPAKAFNLLDLQVAMERALGTRTFAVEDLKGRPETGEVYLAISYGPQSLPAILAVSADGSIHKIDLSKEAGPAIALRDVPARDLTFWNNIPERSLTVSDMRWHDGKLYVAGLSNQTFASTLRVIDWKSRGTQALTSVGIFHTSHDQMETRAPIRTMSFVTLDGVDYLIAAYMCTPLVAIPVADLKDGAHITGKTIAELGYGNTPIDMVTYSAPDETGKPTDYLTVTNVNRNAATISLASLTAAVARPGLTKDVPWSVITGVDVVQSPIAGAIAIDNFGDKQFVLARRDLATGDLQLVTLQKAVKLRISDYVSEYDFPSYAYAPGKQTQYIKPIEDGLMREEGYASPIAKSGPKVSR